MSKHNYHDPITLEELADIKCETTEGKVIILGYRMRKSTPTIAEAAQSLAKAARCAGSAVKEFVDISRQFDRQITEVASVPKEYINPNKTRNNGEPEH